MDWPETHFLQIGLLLTFMTQSQKESRKCAKSVQKTESKKKQLIGVNHAFLEPLMLSFIVLTVRFLNTQHETAEPMFECLLDNSGEPLPIPSVQSMGSMKTHSVAERTSFFATDAAKAQY